LWIWHTPSLFQATLQSDLIHSLQHVSFLLSALLFWWAILHGGRAWMGYGAATFYAFTTSIHSGALGALLTFSSVVWYPAYRMSTAAWGLTPLEDQQLGGLLMWIPAGLVYLFTGLALIAGWLRQTETRAQQRQRYRSHPPAAPHPIQNTVAAFGMVFSLLMFTACKQNNRGQATSTGSDVERGRVAIRYYGCPACHTIPGVPGADGLVGPPLAGIASRIYLGGTVPNTPENIMRWIQRPQTVAPGTAMPNIPMSEQEARDISGYLYTLR
jgi:cytochrome c2